MKDRERLRTLIAEGVAKFCTSPEAVVAPPITRIDVRFDLLGGDCPIVEAYLDTDAEGHPDTGTSKTYSLMDVGFEEWASACQAVDEEDEPTVTITSHTGKTDVRTERELDAVVGEFFVDLVKSLRNQGAFKPLRRASACYLGVSGYDSSFSWPRWENRGPDNMV